MPNLASLTVQSDFDDGDDPFTPPRWRFLSEKTRLRRLQIVVSEGYGLNSLPSLPLPFSPSSVPPFSSITHLDITVKSDEPCPEIAHFALSFVSLSSLSLSTSHNFFDDFPSLLSALPQPSKLLYLSLDAEGEFDLSSLLPAFVNLNSLRICRAPGIDGYPFFNALKKLEKLEELEIGRATYTDPVGLVNLVSGERKHPTLKLLRLDHFADAAEGASIKEVGPYWNSHRRRWTIHDSFRLPLAYEHREGEIDHYEHLFAMAKQNHVEITGNVFEGIRIIKLEQEEQELVKRWKDRPPPFSVGEKEYYTQHRSKGESWRGRGCTCPEPTPTMSCEFFSVPSFL
jgi:hypothetical protein